MLSTDPVVRAVLLSLSLALTVGCNHPHAAAPDAANDAAGTEVASALRDTGLYSDWDSRTIDPANRAYAPGFPLYSDNADKSRWLYLPPGAQIDVSDMDEWTFPVGTKLWKEMRADVTLPNGDIIVDQRIETRMLRKRSASDWDTVTYVWSQDQHDATLALETAPPPIPFPGTTYYEVPVLRCHACHDGRQDKVLGFEAALLAAPEAAPWGVSWSSLVAEGLVTSSGTLPTNTALQFMTGGTTLERQAIGYLHVNCGIACHNASAGQDTPFYTRLELGSAAALPTTIDQTAAFQTAVNVPSIFTPANAPNVDYRIRPTDPSRSTVVYRMDLRNGLSGGGEQMPPIATHLVDVTGVLIMQRWIEAMTGPPYPTPGP